MSLSKLAIAAFAGLTVALPAEQLPTKRQISLPPLIPSIPGVTEPLSSNAPPLPILQLPTPALPEPPYTPSNIRPKKIGYFATSSGDNTHSDFLASFSLDDDTFGTLLRITPIKSSGNSPHHSGISHDGKTIWFGGLLSLLKTQDTGYYFDVSDPYNPKFKKSDRALLSSIADEVRPKPDGGFFFTYMGSAAGTDVGRLVETDADYNIIHEWPEDVAGTLNVLGQQFNPHGLSVDFDNGFILTSDFIVPASILKPTVGKISADTLRLWDLPSRKIINTITIPNGGGIQDVKFIPGREGKEPIALATAVRPGQVWAIYPERLDEHGKPGRTELFVDLGEKAKENTAILVEFPENGKHAYFTCTTSNHVAQFDISDLNHPKRLDDPNTQHPIVGPHYIKVAPDQKHVLITDYFVQTGDIGILNTPGDFKAQWTDIKPDGTLSFNRSINFQQVFANRGGAKPHSSVIIDLSDPKHPKWY